METSQSPPRLQPHIVFPTLVSFIDHDSPNRILPPVASSDSSMASSADKRMSTSSVALISEPPSQRGSVVSAPFVMSVVSPTNPVLTHAGDIGYDQALTYGGMPISQKEREAHRSSWAPAVSGAGYFDEWASYYDYYSSSPQPFPQQVIVVTSSPQPTNMPHEVIAMYAHPYDGPK
ncbi:hypothetical protein BC829DRAFT_189335 [Chytridium lagenaria]|nr:hypothetical protein BC829DRAFT_189335 [Chytridium lagenaria]